MKLSRIPTASTAELKARLESIDTDGTDSTEYDAILEELDQREHDLSDPSSGLGCFQPS